MDRGQAATLSEEVICPQCLSVKIVRDVIDRIITRLEEDGLTSTAQLLRRRDNPESKRFQRTRLRVLCCTHGKHYSFDGKIEDHGFVREVHHQTQAGSGGIAQNEVTP